jgi:hypothetical protein
VPIVFPSSSSVVTTAEPLPRFLTSSSPVITLPGEFVLCAVVAVARLLTFNDTFCIAALLLAVTVAIALSELDADLFLNKSNTDAI